MDGCVEEIATLEEIEFEDEEIARNNTTELLDEITSCLCGSTYTTISIRYFTQKNLMAARDIPVAIISSTIKTVCPGATASCCIWKKSSPYSFLKLVVTVGPGIFPCFLTGAKPQPSLSARPGPKRKPLASSATTTSGFVGKLLATSSSRAARRVSCMRASAKSGRMSTKSIPGIGKSGKCLSAPCSVAFELASFAARVSSVEPAAEVVERGSNPSACWLDATKGAAVAERVDSVIVKRKEK